MIPSPAKSQQETTLVAKCYPYHTDEPEDDPVYHDHDDCPDGKRVITKVRGDDGRPRCKECIKLG